MQRLVERNFLSKKVIVITFIQILGKRNEVRNTAEKRTGRNYGSFLSVMYLEQSQEYFKLSASSPDAVWCSPGSSMVGRLLFLLLECTSMCLTMCDTHMFLII